MAQYQTFILAISFLYLFIIPVHLCFATASKKPSGFSLKLIHRDSPESPLYLGDDLSFHERMSRYVKWTNARASHLASMVTQNATTVAGILRPPVFADGYYYYMVRLGIGTPLQDVMLLLDTGADLSWTQCEPCDSCYEQAYPIYNSADSKTFKLLQCNHPLCSGILECKANTCSYDLYYGSGGTHTIGVAMTETLTFETNEGEQLPYSDIIMGCSKNQQNFEFERSGSIAGILGLTSSPHSIVSQLDGINERKFSYCLPNDPEQSSYLRFGSDIVVRGTGQVQSTPFVRIGATFYFGLDLSDISIADQPINYPPGTFAPRATGGGGCFIDSGAPFSVIDRPAFNTFIAAFENSFAPTVIKRNIEDCTDGDSYCYYFEGVGRFPDITLHFAEGAKYSLQPENYIVTFGEWFMLAFKPRDLTILGAWQQHNMRIIYDLDEGNLSFVSEDCSGHDD